MNTIERLYRVSAADSVAVQEWREKARVAAISALSLATEPSIVVFGSRNSKGALNGLAACYTGIKAVILAHLATKDDRQGVGSELVQHVKEYAGDLPVKTTPEEGAASFYEKLGWRKVGKEYWSK